MIKEYFYSFKTAFEIKVLIQVPNKIWVPNFINHKEMAVFEFFKDSFHPESQNARVQWKKPPAQN